MTNAELHRRFDAAWALVKNLKTLTTGADARDRNGRPSDPTDHDAVCWCSRGAVIKEFPEFPRSPHRANVFVALNRVAETNWGVNFIGVNDDYDYEVVLRMWSDAKEMLLRDYPPESQP